MLYKHKIGNMSFNIAILPNEISMSIVVFIVIVMMHVFWTFVVSINSKFYIINAQQIMRV